MKCFLNYYCSFSDIHHYRSGQLTILTSIHVCFILTTPTAHDDSNSSLVRTAKYDTLTSRYRIRTVKMEIIIARGTVLKLIKKKPVKLHNSSTKWKTWLNIPRTWKNTMPKYKSTSYRVGLKRAVILHETMVRSWKWCSYIAVACKRISTARNWTKGHINFNLSNTVKYSSTIIRWNSRYIKINIYLLGRCTSSMLKFKFCLQ